MSDPMQINTLEPGQIQYAPQADYSPAERAAESEVRAMVEARCVMASRRPRNVHQVRAKVMDACGRPTFALSAMYRKPVGKKDGKMQYAEGPSIRFAEEAYRCMGNLWASITIQFENSEKRVLRFDLMDLESNNTDSAIITIQKTVERRFIKEGQAAISSRVNSYGDKVYLVEATDDDLLIKQQAAVAKARRDAIMRAFPSDIKEDCIAKIRKTLADRDTADPRGALNALLDAFQDLRVLPEQVEKFLGHGLDIISPAELMALRGVYTSIKDGESSWAEQLAAVEEDREGTLKDAAAKVAARKSQKSAGAEAGKAQGGGEAPPAGEASGDTPETNQGPKTPLEKAKAQASKAGSQISGGGTLDIPT